MNHRADTTRTQRKLWVGSGIAAIAAAVAILVGTGGIPRDQDVRGTIVPAARYRAPQVVSADMPDEADRMKATDRRTPDAERRSIDANRRADSQTSLHAGPSAELTMRKAGKDQ